MDEQYFKKILSTVVFLGLLVLTFFLIKPILASIVVGLIITFIFFPFYKFLFKKTHSANLSASIICLILALIIIIPLWLLVPMMVTQSIQAYRFVQGDQFRDVLFEVSEYFPMPENFEYQIISSVQSFARDQLSEFDNYLIDILLNSPAIFLHLLVVFFVVFFSLKEKDALIDYIKSILPFKEKVKNKLVLYSREITVGVIYGQIIVGIGQGIFAGIGFFIFGVENAILLTLLACLAGALPVLGAALVWVPVAAFGLLSGSIGTAVGVTIFGLIASTVDNFIRPYFVSRKTLINSAIVLIGMIGGVMMMGVIGLVLGPLIISYLLIIIEIYRDKKGESFLDKAYNLNSIMQK